MRSPRRKIRLRLFGGLALLGVVFVASVWLLLSTEWGTQQVWSSIQKRLPEGLEIEEVSGPLRSPLELRGVSFKGEFGGVNVSRVMLEWRLLPLLRRTLLLRRLEIEGVDIALDTAATGPEEGETPAPLPDLVLPVSVLLGEGVVRGVSLVSGGDEEGGRRLDSLRVEGLSFGDRLELPSLSLAGPDGRIALSGWIQPRGAYPFLLELSGVVEMPDQPPLEGGFSISGNLQHVAVRGEITAPVAAEILASVLDPRGEIGFELEVTVPEADARLIRGDWPEARGGGTLAASGTLDSLHAEGSFRMELPQVGVVELQAAIRKNGSTVEIDKLQATRDGSRIDAEGRMTLTDAEPELDLSLAWKNLRWPLQGPAEVVSGRGTMAVLGTPSSYHLVLEGSGSKPGVLSAPVSLRGRGTRESLHLEDLRAQLLDGGIRATGDVSWAPEVRWDLHVSGEELDPSPLVEDSTQWRGRLNLRARTRGMVGTSEVEGELVLESLNGTLREEEITASADASFRLFKALPEATPLLPQGLLRSLELDWGPNHLSASGIIADTLDLDLQLSAPDLEVVAPGVAGGVEVEGRLTGARASPQVKVGLMARGLRFGEGAAEEVWLDAEVDSDVGGIVAVEGRATRVTFRGEEQLDSLTLDVRGTPEAHHLETRLIGPRGSLELVAEGGLLDRVWSAAVEAMNVTADPWGDWSLVERGRVALSASAAEMERLCWQSESANVCAEASWEAEGPTEFTASVRGLELGRFQQTLPEEWTLAGSMGADAAFRIAADRSLWAEAEANVGLVQVGYPTRRGQREFRFSDVLLSGGTDEDGTRAEVGMRVSAEGALDVALLEGRVALPGLTHLGLELLPQPLSGNLQAYLTDFSAVEALIPEVEEVTADLRVDVSVSGSVGHPELQGEARLVDGSLDIPSLGLALRNVQAVARGRGAEGVDLEGQLSSGSGMIGFTGIVPTAPSDSTPAKIQLRGEGFLAADLPEVSVWISPDLDISAYSERVDVLGLVQIPRARVELTEVSPYAVPSSRDVVFVEDTAAAPASGPAIHTSVRMVLGDSITFRGFGFSAEPRGSILATGAPDRATTGTGELILTGGRYRAYGQDLTMQRGRILFAGGPIDNPGLDIRATRTARDGVVSGLEMKGTLRRPETTLFSDPAMMQSEVLAYIVLGRPLGTASTEEGGRVAGAAASLGLKGGNVLAGRIGKRFGLEEVSIQAEGPLEEAALVAGKYLTPQFYISYGVGLFEPASLFRMRYLLSSRWTLQAETGKAAGADLLYRIERGR